jgi:asparagine synthase (glutamine-hydrolysing)
MFALALWDNDTQRLFLCRDRLGIKPLYYHQTAQGEVLFASEIKSLFGALDATSWQIDPEGLAQYLTYQNQFGATTLFEGIKILEPGCIMEISSREQHHTRYWNVRVADQVCNNFQEAKTAFQDTLRASVARHLMSDVGVASYLSAGFDSSAVASTASSLLPEPPQTFTGWFPEGGWYNEMSGAASVAHNIQAPHFGVDITAENAMEEMDVLIHALDAPQMGMGALPQYLVACEAAQHCKVILTGHGGDELFSGYPVFKLAELLSAMKSGPKKLWQTLRRLRRSELPHIIYFSLALLRGGASSALLPVLFSRKHQSDALAPHVWEALKDRDPTAALTEIKAKTCSLYETILTTYLTIYLPGLLIVEDKISMAHSLESRTPLLDNEMVDLALSIAPETKLHNGILKALIKEGTRSILPSELYTLPKRGFPTPLRTWLRGPMKDWMAERLLGVNSPLRRLFKPEYLQETVQQYHRSIGRKFRPLDELPSHRIWMLLSLEAWLRQTEKNWNIRLDIKSSSTVSNRPLLGA